MLRRAFCVATAIALLTARSSAAWAVVEDVGTSGPAILDDASGSSGPSNVADALRSGDARFGSRDPSVGSTSLSFRGRIIPIVGAGLEPSQEGQVDPGQSPTAFDSNLSEDHHSGAPDAISPAVNTFGAVDADIILNFGDDSMITDPVGGLGYWTTIHGSPSLALSAEALSPRRFQASCSGDGSTSAVIRCEVLELGIPTDGNTGSSGAYQSEQRSFGFEGATSSGAPPSPQATADTKFSMPGVYFSVANDATLPAVTAGVFDFANLSGNSNTGPIDPGIFDLTQGPAPSIPEIPTPVMIAIGLGGMALVRRLQLHLRSPARVG